MKRNTAEMFDKLAASAARWRRMALTPNDWRDISTAPHDGSLVFAWREGWERPKYVRWMLNPRTQTEFWNDADELDAYELEHEPPTHWLLIPATPEAKS